MRVEEPAPNCHNIHLPLRLSVCMCVCEKESERSQMYRKCDKYKDNKIGWLHGKTEIREGVGRAIVTLELRARLIIYLFTTVCSPGFTDISGAFFSLVA